MRHFYFTAAGTSGGTTSFYFGLVDTPTFPSAGTLKKLAIQNGHLNPVILAISEIPAADLSKFEEGLY